MNWSCTQKQPAGHSNYSLNYDTYVYLFLLYLQYSTECNGHLTYLVACT